MSTLYVVATPIGNLEDVTARAVRILGEVGAIAAEDTRVTARLLARYGIRKPLISYRAPVERRGLPRVLAARQTVETKYQMAACVRQYVQLYEQMAGHE